MLPQNKINTGNSTTAVEDEVVEKIEVDLDEEVEVEDSTGDVNVAAKIPPHNVYMIKWKPSKNEEAVYPSKTKSEPHRAFVGAGFVGDVQDEEWEGTMVFVNHINSLQRKGKPTSDLHHFLNTVGNPAPNRQTIRELLEHTRETIAQEPVGYAEIDWRASYKKDDGTYTEVKTTMEGFPKHYVDENGETVSSAKEGKWDGSYVQSIPHPVTGEPIEAQLYVRKFLNQAEANKLKGKMRST